MPNHWHLVLYPENDILATNGKSIRRKLINYTSQTLKGSSESWDAWKYPGYY